MALWQIIQAFFQQRAVGAEPFPIPAIQLGLQLSKQAVDLLQGIMSVQRRLDVTLSFTASDYGSSQIASYNPEAEGLVPQWAFYD